MRQLSLFTDDSTPERDGPTVVNFKDYKSTAALDEAFGDRWHYIGRPGRHPLGKSALANPYKVKPHGPHTRAQSVELYRSWLWRQIGERNQDVLNELKRLDESSVLVCWCSPLKCHGDIVAGAVMAMRAGVFD